MWAHHVCALLFACRQASSFLQTVQFVDLAGNRAKSCKQSTLPTTSKSSPSCLMQSVLYLHTDLYRESTIHYTSPHKLILNSYPVKEVKKALSEQAGQHFISCFFVFDAFFCVSQCSSSFFNQSAFNFQNSHSSGYAFPHNPSFCVAKYPQKCTQIHYHEFHFTVIAVLTW